MTDHIFWLASNSPRRKEMLSWSDWRLEIVPPGADESIKKEESPEEYVRRLALLKVSGEIDEAAEGEFVISADTTVVLDGRILGKPADENEARDMLAALKARLHEVITCVAVRVAGGQPAKADVCVSAVRMRAYSDEEMDAYIASGDPMDKAGAYAIQNDRFNPAPGFRGCMASVMGLPLCHMERTLRKFSDYAQTDWPTICQKNLKYDCPVTDRIMAGMDFG